MRALAFAVQPSCQCCLLLRARWRSVTRSGGCRSSVAVLNREVSLRVRATLPALCCSLCSQAEHVASGAADARTDLTD